MKIGRMMVPIEAMEIEEKLINIERELIGKIEGKMIECKKSGRGEN